MFRRVHVTTSAGKLRHTARGPVGSARALLLAMALGVSLLAAACGGGGGGSSNPPPPITLVSITVTPDNLAVFPGAEWAFIATGNFSDGSNQNLTSQVAWGTSNSNIVSIDTMGGALAENTPGPATISATSGGIVGTTTATVVDACNTTGRSTTQTVGGLIPFSTLAGNLFNFNVVIPVNSVAIGIILRSATTDFVLIDHLGAVTIPGRSITGPGGGAVPLSLNQIDFNGDGNETNDASGLFNAQAEALFFPNGGVTATLLAGTYTFPAGVTAATNIGPLISDTLTPTVFYKTASPSQPAMNLNLFVVQNVGGKTIMDSNDALADSVIAGAIQSLRNVYESQVCLTLNVTVRVINNEDFQIIETLSELDTLFSTNPFPAENNALNIFIVDTLMLFPDNVIGVSAGVPGPFNLDGTIVSGTVAEYIDDGTGASVGFILAHEFGHFVGLFHSSQTNSSQTAIIGHDPIADTPECTTADMTPGGINNCPDRSNFMFPVIDNNTNPPITAGQSLVIKLNPAVSAP